MENVCVNDIILTENQSRIQIDIDKNLEYGKIFSIAKEFNIDIITQNPDLNALGNKIFISIDSFDAKNLSEKLKSQGINSIVVDKLSKISITGIGVKTNISVFYGIISKLNKSGIKIWTISTSEVKISILIDKKDQEIAVKSLSNF